MEELMNEPKFKTGFIDIDRVIGGIYPGELILISSKFTKGKTAFLGSIIKNVAFSNGNKGLLFSLEMPEMTFQDRWVSALSDIPMQEIRSSRLREKGSKLYKTILDEVCDLPIIIDEDRDKSIDDLCSVVRKMVKDEGVEIIYIDELGYLEKHDDKVPFADVISDWMHKLKQLARELNIPIIFTWGIGGWQESYMPKLEDLHNPTIVDNSDVILFLRRERVSDEVPYCLETVNVAKNNYGETGEIKLLFSFKTISFYNLDLPYENNLRNITK